LKGKAARALKGVKRKILSGRPSGLEGRRKKLRMDSGRRRDKPRTEGKRGVKSKFDRGKRVLFKRRKGESVKEGDEIRTILSIHPLI